MREGQTFSDKREGNMVYSGIFIDILMFKGTGVRARGSSILTSVAERMKMRFQI